MRIEDEIKQKSFASQYVKAHVNVLFTSSWLSYESSKQFKTFGITGHQFNILRILRGMYPNPGSIKELTERMIDKTSNASRLVDKLITKGLVQKAKCSQDNRRAEVVITEQGLRQLEKITELMNIFADNLSQNINSEEVIILNNLLDKLRG